MSRHLKRRAQNPIKYLPWSFFVKIANGFGFAGTEKVSTQRAKLANSCPQQIIKPSITCLFRQKFFSRYSSLGIIHFVTTQHFPKNQHFLPPHTHTCLCVSGGKKRWFFGRFCKHTKQMSPMGSPKAYLRPCQTSMMELFDYQPLNVFAKKLPRRCMTGS